METWLWKSSQIGQGLRGLIEYGYRRWIVDGGRGTGETLVLLVINMKTKCQKLKEDSLA